MRPEELGAWQALLQEEFEKPRPLRKPLKKS